jgi:hypothetical protein
VLLAGDPAVTRRECPGRACSTDRATTDEIGVGPIRPNDDQTNQKGIATMKLTTTTFVSVDGVMQGIGGPDEDRSGGFERGGWTTPLWDNEAGTFLNQVYQRADAFLFGRRTYEIFAGSWGVVDDPSINPIATALNTGAETGQVIDPGPAVLAHPGHRRLLAAPQARGRIMGKEIDRRSASQSARDSA